MEDDGVAGQPEGKVAPAQLPVDLLEKEEIALVHQPGTGNEGPADGHAGARDEIEAGGIGRRGLAQARAEVDSLNGTGAARQPATVALQPVRRIEEDDPAADYREFAYRSRGPGEGGGRGRRHQAIGIHYPQQVDFGVCQ